MNAIVADKIACGSYTLTPRRKGRSLIWAVVSEIVKEDGTKLENAVCCRSCRRILKFNANQTSNLSRHKCVKALRSKNTEPVNDHAKKEALNAVSNWIVEDCLPFSIINGSGFKAMVQFFIKIGVTYGERIDIDDLLPDESTISYKCRDEANEKRQETSYMLQDAVNRGGFSLTVELVPDNYLKRILLGVSVHFEQDFQIVNMLLGLKSVDSQKANSEIIREKLETLLSTFGIQSMENIKFVTDRETNIVKALEPNVRLNCSTHLFTEVLDKSFQETLRLVDMLNDCKQIIKYLKKENAQDMQNISLKNSCTTLWKSNYTICKLFCDNWSDIHSLLTNLKEVHRLNNININTLHEIVELCDNFEIIFIELQKETSLCFVLPSIYKVQSLCEPKDTKETAAILVFKQNINKYVSDIWENNISMWHRAAFFLYPPALNMNIEYLDDIQNFCVIETEKISATVNTIQTEELIIKSENVSDSEDSTSTKSPTPSNNESIHKNKFFFSNLVQQSNGKKTPFDEIEKYSREKVFLTEDFEVIDWWKCNKLFYPHLSRFALQVHTIPASSTTVISSLAGNITKEKQNKLAPNSLDSLLFLNSFYKSQNE